MTKEGLRQARRARIDRINVNDKARITKVDLPEQHLLDKTGRVVLITDEVKCVVALNGGGGLTVHLSQLTKIA